jgi:two-component system cell cycle response regulator
METLDPLKNTNGNVTILLIEDSVTQAQQLQYTLEEEHFKVDWVENGKEALKYLETKIPTIIVSDVLMPEMDGFEFCAVIKKEPRYAQIPIILLTTLSDPQDIIRGLDSGADNFITKPYDKDYLLSRIAYILTNQKLRRMPEKRSSEMGLEIFFAGKKQFITSEKMQIIDLLFSTFEAVIQKNAELERLNKELKEAYENIRVLKGLIPICSSCKKVRNDDGFWEQVEVYISDHSEADFSHSLCPDCVTKLYPDLHKKKKK